MFNARRKAIIIVLILTLFVGGFGFKRVNDIKVDNQVIEEFQEVMEVIENKDFKKEFTDEEKELIDKYLEHDFKVSDSNKENVEEFLKEKEEVKRKEIQKKKELKIQKEKEKIQKEKERKEKERKEKERLEAERKEAERVKKERVETQQVSTQKPAPVQSKPAKPTYAANHMYANGMAVAYANVPLGTGLQGAQNSVDAYGASTAWLPFNPNDNYIDYMLVHHSWYAYFTDTLYPGTIITVTDAAGTPHNYKVVERSLQPTTSTPEGLISENPISYGYFNGGENAYHAVSPQYADQYGNRKEAFVIQVCNATNTGLHMITALPM